MTINTETYAILTNFKNINSKNGKYLKNTVFGSKNVTKKLKMKASLLVNQKRKKQWSNVLKNIHNFRIDNLHNIQNKECRVISDKLKNINVTCNDSFKFEVDNNEELNKDLQNLLKNYTDNNINKVIKKEFTENEKLEEIDLIIDKNKLKKIAEHDFAIATKKIIAKVEDPKAIKYLYNFIEKLDKNKVSDKLINDIKKALANQTSTIITDLLATKNSDNQKKIEDFHALLTICNRYDINISKNNKKQILNSCLSSFDVIATKLNSSSNDLYIINQQYKDLSKLKYSVVNSIIRNTANNPDKKIIKSNEKLLLIKKWTDLTINKHNQLIQKLENNRKQVIDKGNNITTLINKTEDLLQKHTIINNKLAEQGLSQKEIKALNTTKKEIYAKSQESSLKLEDTWKQLYDLLDDIEDKQIELYEHINIYKNIPKNELPEKNYNTFKLINNDIQQQIDAKIDDFPETNSIKQLVNNAKATLEYKYGTSVSLLLIKSILENTPKHDDFTEYFTEKINHYAQANMEDNSTSSYASEVPVNETNQLQSTESLDLNKTTEAPNDLYANDVNAGDNLAVPLVPQAPPLPSIAPTAQNNNILANKLQAPDRQNLLKDIRNSNPLKNLKKVSKSGITRRNKVKKSPENNHFLEKSPAFKKAVPNSDENSSSSKNATDDNEWT